MKCRITALVICIFSQVYCDRLIFIDEPDPTTGNPKHLKEFPNEDIQIRSGASDRNFCNCTNLFQCNLGGNSNEHTSGENVMEGEDNGADVEVIDIRFTHGSCQHYLEICCNVRLLRNDLPTHDSFFLLSVNCIEITCV